MAKSKNPTTFSPGKSGNPTGRPKGSKNATTLVKEAVAGHFDNIVARDMPKIFKLMVKEALGFKRKVRVKVPGTDGKPDTWEDKTVDVEPDKEMQKFLTKQFIEAAGGGQKDGGKQAVTAISITVTKGGDVEAEGRTFENTAEN